MNAAPAFITLHSAQEAAQWLRERVRGQLRTDSR